jgi:hypothetical protein
MRLFRGSNWVFLALMLIAPLSWSKGESSQGILLSTNLGLFNQTEEEGATKTELNVMNSDVNLGIVLSSGLYLGGIYGSQNNDDGSQKPQASHYGASLGLITGSWLLNLHYLMGGELKKQAANTNWEECSGLQADLGYLMNVAGPFYFGWQLSYRSLKYEKKMVNAVESVGAEALERVEYFPSIRLTFIW